MKRHCSARICKAWMLFALCVLIIACGEDSEATGGANETDGMIDEASGSSKASNETEGILVDARDGQSYRIVSIGTQTWMAQNLNYDAAGSYCYDDFAGDCDRYGRLYTWAAAMDSAGIWSEDGKGCGYDNTCTPNYPVRGVCPEGWHLPTRDEWDSLLTFDGALLGGSSRLEQSEYDLLITAAPFKSLSGWKKDGNGTDDYGFSVLPAGRWNRSGQGVWYYDYEGEAAFFWSSYEYSSGEADNLLISMYNFAFLHQKNRKYEGLSVRCLKDDGLGHSAKSSSSQKMVSSSSKIPEYIEGSLVDSRDGQTYKTVTIGSQTWMAENLNYKPDDYVPPTLSTGSNYGFTIYESIDSTSKLYGDVTQDVCPNGWHLPDTTEWQILFTAVGGKSSAGMALKSTTGWLNGGNGLDLFGFSALPIGGKYYGKKFFYDNKGIEFGDGDYVGVAGFWSSTESERTTVGVRLDAYVIILHYRKDAALLYELQKNNAFPVRCLKDSK